MIKSLILNFFRAVALLIILGGCVQQPADPGYYSIVFYNVENLFDTIDEPEKNDERYLPGSELKWDTEKYSHKLNQLSRVLSSIDTGALPTVIGLSEVENRLVLEDLLEMPSLNKGDYKIIHQESPDERGIDMAMLYRHKYFQPDDVRFIPVNFPFDIDEKTRDILYVKGRIMDQPLHIYFNHWTSRWGGHLVTNPHRKYTARLLRDHADSILQAEPNADILIMGDLNDNPTDTSIYMILQAFPLTMDIYGNELYNLMLDKYARGQGTLFWKEWDMFDQIIVNGNYLEKIDLENNDLIFKRDWMLYERRDGDRVPNRTAGSSYYGGFSDHLPVYLRVKY